MKKYQVKITHPEWLEHSTPGKTIDLFVRGRLPSNIAGWMMVTSLRHPLRCIYGSDLRAALNLLWLAIYAKWDTATGLHIFLWRSVRLFQRSERDYWLAHGLSEEELDDDLFDKLLETEP